MIMNQPQIPIVRVKFCTGAPDFIYSVEQWQSGGKYKGFLKDNCMSIRDIDEIVYGTFMPFNEFHNLPAWEG